MQFCARCGEAVEEATVFAAPQKTALASNQPDALEHADERIIFSIRPTMLFVKIGYLTAFLGAAVIAGLFMYLAATFLFTILWWLAIPLGLLLLLIPAFYHVRRNLVRFTLTESKLEIDKGLIARQTHIVPLGKIQDVTVSASMWQRLLGYGNLIIENAGEADGKIVLNNINAPRKHADLMLREMRRNDE